MKLLLGVMTFAWFALVYIIVLLHAAFVGYFSPFDRKRFWIETGMTWGMFIVVFAIICLLAI